MKKTILLTAVGALAAASCISSPADARRHIRGHSVRAATRQNNATAGTAKEVAPDSRQSATGGQPGGLPGR